MRASGSTEKLRAYRPTLESLEEREVLSGYTPTAVEQLFLEQLNDARANPTAYGQSIGLNLSNVAPSQPLAFDSRLIQASRDHSTDMAIRGYFAHNTPEGTDPGSRISAVGYNWNAWGESLAAGSAYPGPAEALKALIIDDGVPDLGHRKHLLAIDSIFKGQNQVGVGIVQNSGGPYTNYYTIDSASTPGGLPQITGTVINDANGNGKYDIGEGLGNVTIMVAGVGSTTSYTSGGYSIGVQPGTYTVTASGGGLSSPIVRTITVGSTNARLTLTAGSDNFIQKIYQTVLNRPAGAAEVGFWMSVMQGPAGLTGIVTGIEQSGEARTRLVKSWYVTYLGRQAVNGEEQVFVNGMIHGASEEDALSGILASDEFVARSQLTNSGTPEQHYIASLYQLVLGRSGSAGEIGGWVSVLDRVGRGPVVAAFIHSAEYRGNVVRSYYTNLLHRSAAPGASEVASWVNSQFDLLHIREGFESSAEFFSH